MLVTKVSAPHCRPWEDEGEHVCAISRDHSNMVKFGPNDDEYAKVCILYGASPARSTGGQEATAVESSDG